MKVEGEAVLLCCVRWAQQRLQRPAGEGRRSWHAARAVAQSGVRLQCMCVQPPPFVHRPPLQEHAPDRHGVCQQAVGGWRVAMVLWPLCTPGMGEGQAEGCRQTGATGWHHRVCPRSSPPLPSPFLQRAASFTSSGAPLPPACLHPSPPLLQRHRHPPPLPFQRAASSTSSGTRPSSPPPPTCSASWSPSCLSRQLRPRCSL